MIELVLSLLSVLSTAPDAKCSSTIFGYKGDKWSGGNALYLARPVNSSDIGIAHRRYPLGSRVLVYLPRTNRHVVATVIDRGPYGAIAPDGTWFVKAGKNRYKPGRFRGCADLTPKLARLLQHKGRERIHIWRLHKRRR